MKTRYIVIISFLIIILLTYYFVLIKSKKKCDRNFYAVCYTEDKINIGIASTFHYISDYKILRKGNSVYVEIFVTTLSNFFHDGKKINLSIDKENIEKLYINDIPYELDFKCQSQ